MPKLTPAMKKLNIKQRRFVKNYAKHGNKTQAVMDAYGYKGTTKKKQTASAYGSELSNKPAIKEALKEELAKVEGLSVRQVLQRKANLLDIGEESLDKQKVTPELYNKTLDSVIDLYKYLDVSNLQQHNAAAVHYHLHQAPKTEVLKKRNEYAEFFKEIQED